MAEEAKVKEPALTPEQSAELQEAAKTGKYIKQYKVAERLYGFNIMSSKDEEDWRFERAVHIVNLSEAVLKAAPGATQEVIPRLIADAVDIFDQRQVVKRQLVSIDNTRVTREEINNLMESGAMSSELLNQLSSVSQKHRREFTRLISVALTDEDGDSLKK